MGKSIVTILKKTISSKANLKATNDFVHSGNKITMVPSAYSGDIWLNYRTVGGTNGNISVYNLGNGAGGLAGLNVANISANIISPRANDTYDIGSISNRFKYVYARGFAAENGDALWVRRTSGAENKTIYTSDNDVCFYAIGHLYMRANNLSTNKSHIIDLFREQSDGMRTILRPFVNGTCYLGSAGYRWNTAFFTNSITASDLKEKDVIEEFDFKEEEFIMNLRPIAYKRNGEYDGGKRIHLGFGAQDVAKVINDLNIGDMAMVQASVVEEELVERENEQGEAETVTERVEKPYHGEEIDDEKLSWGLNYTEIIPLLVKMIQKQQKTIEKLSERLEKLEVSVE